MALTEKEEELINNVKELLDAFFHIPVHNEVGIPKESALGKRTAVIFTYDDWNLDFRYWLWLNNGQTELKVGTDFTLDSDTGEIAIVTTGDSVFVAKGGELPVGQQIEASYHFKYFTDDQLLCFMNIGLDAINNYRPVTGYASIDEAPAEFRASLIIYTYYRALSKLLLDNSIWRNNLIWATNWVTMTSQQFHQYINQLKDEAWKEFQEFAKLAKSRGFAKPRAVVSGKFSTQMRVTGANFRSFTILGNSL